MRERIYRYFFARILVIALFSLGVIAISDAPASAVGTTPQTISPPTISTSASAPSTVAVPTDSSSGLPVSISVTSSPSGACSISGKRVTYLTLGTCYIAFDQAGDATFAPAPQLVVTVMIVSVATTFIGSKFKEMTILDSPFQAEVVSSSGAPITYSVIIITGQASKCSSTSTGLIAPLAVGECTIRMDVNNSGSFVAASENFSLRIVKARQAALNLTAPSRLDPSGLATIQVTGGSGTGAVTLSATGDCTVSGMTVAAASSGSLCTLTATKASDSVYSEASISQVINISPASTGGSGGSSGGGVTPGPVTSSDNSGDITFVLDKVATKLIKPSLDATDVFNSTGGQLVFTGRNLLSVQQVFVKDNLPVKIVKATDAVMTIELPKASLLGWQSLTLVTSGGKKVLTDSVRYVAPVVLKAITKTLTGFKVAQKALSKTQIVALKKFVKSVGKFKTVECRGLSSNATITCKYLKRIYKAGRVKVTKLRIKATSPAAKQVQLVFTR